MFDAALADALVHMQRSPAIVRSMAPGELERAGDRQFERRMASQLDVAERELGQWKEAGAEVRRELAHTMDLAKTQAIAPSLFLPQLEARILELEAAARDTAVEMDPLATAALGWKRKARRFDSENRRIIDGVADRLLTIMERELEERGDFVLFLKSLAAEFRPRGDAPIFRDGKALRRHLEAKLAS